jgi:hypothetical protein
MPPGQGSRTATLGSLDTGSTSLADPPTIDLGHSETPLGPIDRVNIAMPSQSVALLRVGCSAPYVPVPAATTSRTW